MRTLTCEPSVEVIGVAMLSIVENIHAEELHPHLRRYGLEHIEPTKWYPAERWLNVMNDMAEQTNLMSNLVAIGLKIAEKVMLPPEFANVTAPQILEMWNEVYHMQHRGSDIGHIVAEKIDDKTYKLTLSTLYPDDLEYGVCYGFLRRFLPRGTSFKVWYDGDVLRKDQGGTETIMHVAWE